MYSTAGNTSSVPSAPNAPSAPDASNETTTIDMGVNPNVKVGTILQGADGQYFVVQANGELMALQPVTVIQSQSPPMQNIASASASPRVEPNGSAPAFMSQVSPNNHSVNYNNNGISNSGETYTNGPVNDNNTTSYELQIKTDNNYNYIDNKNNMYNFNSTNVNTNTNTKIITKRGCGNPGQWVLFHKVLFGLSLLSLLIFLIMYFTANNSTIIFVSFLPLLYFGCALLCVRTGVVGEDQTLALFWPLILVVIAIIIVLIAGCLGGGGGGGNCGNCNGDCGSCNCGNCPSNQNSGGDSGAASYNGEFGPCAACYIVSCCHQVDDNADAAQ